MLRQPHFRIAAAGRMIAVSPRSAGGSTSHPTHPAIAFDDRHRGRSHDFATVAWRFDVRGDVYFRRVAYAGDGGRARLREQRAGAVAARRANALPYIF